MRPLKKIFVFLILLIPFSLSAQTADDIITKYVAFIGGKNNWKKVKTLTTSGQYDYGGIRFPFTTYAKAPNLYKFIVRSEGKYFAQSFDGGKGWKIDAFNNETSPKLLAGKEAQTMTNEADVELENPFIDYERKGDTASLEGKEIIDGVNCFVIKFTRQNGEQETYYFEEHTSALIMKVARSKNAELQGAILNTAYSDYRDVKGVKIPFRSVSKSNDQVILEVLIEKAEINKRIDDMEFQFKIEALK